MRFHRFPRHRYRTASPQRLSAARKAVERDRELCGFWPDMMEFATAEERLAAQDKSTLEYWIQLRNHEASAWRRARRELRALPKSTRRGVMRIWQLGVFPGSPVYLLDLIRKVERGACPWRMLADRRRLQLDGCRAKMFGAHAQT